MIPKALAVLVFSGNLLAAEMLPAALSVLSDGNLAVLCSGNKLAFVNSRSAAVRLVQLALTGTAIDVAASGSSEQPAVFISVHGPSMLASPVVQVSGDGRELKRWQISEGYPSGLALDSTNGILYISSLQTASIYRLDLHRTGATPHFVTTIPGASRIGPIAVDAVHNILFAADLFSGDIYEVPLGTGARAVIVRNLGEPAALALGQNGKLLYVADSSHHCVWSVSLERKPAKPVRFWSSKEPLGIAVEGSQLVWVGDRSAKGVFGISPAGQQLKLVR